MYNATSTCPTTASSYVNATTSWTESTTTNNGKYVCLYVQDVAGNYATLASANPINIDISNPIPTLSSTAPAYVSGAFTVNVTWSKTIYNFT